MNRTHVFLKNTIMNYIFRMGNIAVNFFSIPLMLAIMGSERFGIWQTILTIINWANLANLGVGNGLRNKVTQLISYKKYEELKYYISSAYYILLIVSVIITVFSMILTFLIDPNTIFKNNTIDKLEIQVAVIIIVFSFSINFILGLANSILYGLHKSSLVTTSQFLTSFTIFIVLKLIQISGTDNIKIGTMALIFLIATSLVNILLSIFVFKKYVKRPQYKYINKEYGRNLLNVGISFFILQISTIFLFSIDNFLVSTLLGVKEVTAYSIATRLLILFNTLFSILLIQMWNASGDAYNKNDFIWIEKTIKKLYMTLTLMVIIIYLTTLFFDQIVYLWMGQPVQISGLSVKLIGTCVVIQMFNGIAVNIENGTGLIKPQIISYITAGIINVPLTIYLVNRMDMGLNGIIISKIICLLIPAIVCSIHVRKILFRMKRNIA
ncbi:oligosaccharide flippase family protein [Priestia megaterium]|uniref:oligosaccharide flippase family protein n=1 Tax=Priestia megaterium TaxID=1404 RepID=UPI0026E42060|nr:oligosaccharide flippase family protein [Priestia megaterium]MDO6850366.1 oligosaccharide flippase family protein [Priestia megaterium]